MFRSWCIGLSLLAAWVALSGTAVAKEKRAPSILPVERIITFRESVPRADRRRIVEKYGGEVVHEIGLIHAVAARFPSEGAHAADVGIKARPEVVRIEKDFWQNWIETSPPTFADVEFPSVQSIIKPLRLPRQISEIYPEIPWGIDRVNAPKAWAVTQGEGVRVAVIDTGIDFDHPDLKTNVKGGWNATDINTPDNFKDDNGHGTHVSGIIAAVQNSAGVAGVAPKAELYGVKVLSADGSGNFSDVIAGIDWAVSHKMAVVNMSLGAPEGTEALAAAVKAAADAGTVIFAAAGNSGGPVSYPATYPQAIAISATNNRDQLAWFSSRGPQVAFTAPGVNVYSTYMGGIYRTLSGTSMATPHAAGLAALAVAAKGVHGLDPIRNALKASASPLPDLNPEEQGWGLVDAEKLVH